jgi:hypothetical protein
VGEISDTLDDLRIEVAVFTHRYNNEWLIGRHGHHTPREAFHQHANLWQHEQTTQLSNEPGAQQSASCQIVSLVQHSTNDGVDDMDQGANTVDTYPVVRRSNSLMGSVGRYAGDHCSSFERVAS